MGLIKRTPSSQWEWLQGREIYQTISLRSKQAEITKQMSPYRIRHSPITVYLDTSGGDVRTAQRLSRYSRLDTLMIRFEFRNCVI